MVVRQRSTILRQALILISQPSNALTAIRLIPPVWISHNFKATTLGMTRKTMRNRGFEPWTFKSCLGYHHFVINDNNRDQQKKDSKKTSTATVAEIKTKANVTEKASTLVAATDHGDHMTFDSREVSPLRPSSQKIVSTANGNTTPDIQTRQTIGCGIKRGKLYYLDLQSKDSNKLQQALMADGSEEEKKKSEIWLWHRRLGHASFGYLKKLFPSLFAKSDISGFCCDICELAKSHRASFPLILNKSPLPFMVIHSDVWGPSKVPILSGSHWFVTFIDDCTRMTWLCLMKTKDEVNLLFQKFHKMIETQYNAKVQVLRSDNGGEYQSSNLQKYLEELGIIHQTTCSNTPQQNGVAERKYRHLLEVVHASLIAAKILISYWGEAITYVAYLINRVLSSSINFQTPFQTLTNVVVAPTVPNLPPRVFGCVAFVHLHKHQRTKLTSHALQYLIYFSSESELQGKYHKEIQTLDYDYHISEEDESGQSELVNQEVGELDMSGQQFGFEDVFTEIPNQSSSAEGVLNLEPDPFMKRLPHCHNKGIPKPTYEPELSTKVKYLMSNYVSNHRLSKSNKSFVNQLSTVAIPNSVQEVLADPRWKAKNETWELVECPPRKKPVGCSWIYTVKYKADGSIERFKARLVAKGYTQTYGIDYTETFAPVAKINTFDVKNAFLHGELCEKVYMDLPLGCMVLEKQCQKVCKLKKSLYGLKQSPRAWFGRFTKSMRAFGYRQSNSDHTLFLKKQHGKITTLIVYVDDMVVTENDLEERKALQNYLSKEFKMKDLGHLKYFLGIEVSRSSEGIFLSQRKLVERLMYLAHTRPDLAYALSVVSQYMHNPGEQHMNAVMRILRRSTFGYFTFVGGNLVTWKSKKQNVVARSSAEAEFRGIALGLCEALWLRLLLQDLGYLSRQPIRLFCDNKAACDIAHNLVQHDHTKHVEVDRFFIKEKLDDKIVELPKILSEDQLADILTKVVSSQMFSKFLDKLGMCDIYAPT
uniref:Uncharacterized protein n=1 Tax=Vitis vinifera TaxID=29760 RepID=A5AF46_VITVI|nr:hypothetical protein VITISV_039504 [Vitis vinifera]